MATDEISAANDESWLIDCSDDEKYVITPSDMKEVYERIAKGEKFELEWKCPNRRSPTPERMETSVVVAEEKETEPAQPQWVVPAAFDFDASSEGNRSTITPRRLKGITKTPRSNQKRVAQLDKIMNDMIRHKRIDDEAALSEQQASPKS